MCDATKKYLHKYNIPFTQKEISSLSQDEINDFMHRGAGAAPIVVIGNDVYGGFRPDVLRPLRSAV